MESLPTWKEPETTLPKEEKPSNKSDENSSISSEKTVLVRQRSLSKDLTVPHGVSDPIEAKPKPSPSSNAENVSFMAQELLSPQEEAERKEGPISVSSQIPIDHKLAANFLGDAFIKEASLEGSDLEGLSFHTAYSSILSLLEEELVQIQQKGEDDHFIKSMIQSTNQILESILKVTRLSSRDFHTWISEKLTNLKTDESYAMRGGWRGRPNGHNILMEFTKTKNGTYSLKAYNTGAGVGEYHGTGATIDNRDKFPPELIVPDISLDSLQNKESWMGFYNLLQPPKANEISYSAINFYEGFIGSLKPGFIGPTLEEQSAFVERDLIRPARVGVCTIDAFRAFMRGHGSRAQYKNTDINMKFKILDRYDQYILKIEQSAPIESLSADKLQDRIGVLRFLKDCAERYARDILVATKPEHRWISTEMGKTAEALISKVLSHVEDSLKECNGIYKLASQKIAVGVEGNRLNLTMHGNLPEFTINAVFDPKLNSLNGLISEGTSWPLDNTKETLQGWISAIQTEYIEEGDLSKNTARIIDERVHYFLEDIFTNMPYFNDKIWQNIPAVEREECMDLISKISEHFIRTIPASKDPYNFKIDHITNIEKAFGVVKYLSTQLPNDVDNINKCNVSTRYLSLDSGLEGQVGELFLNSPTFEQQTIDNFNLIKGNKESPSKLFQISTDGYPSFQIAVKFEASIDNFEETIEHFIKFKDNIYGKEEYFVYFYLKEHPEVKDRIRQELKQKDPKEPHLSRIVGEALTDLEGKYLPKAFCALRKQAHLTNWLIYNQVKPSTEEINSPGDQEWFKPFLSFQLLPSPDGNIHINRVSRNSAGAWEPTIGWWGDRFKSARRPFSNRHPFIEQAINKRDRYRNSTGIMLGLNDIPNRKPKDLDPALDPNFREILFLGASGDKTQQAVKTISYFKQNLAKLQDSDYQTLFQMRMLEPGILSKQLVDHPDFAIILAEFVNQGYNYAQKILHDIPSALFFLRMSSYFKAYCNNALKNGKPPSAFPQFPNVMNEMEGLWKESYELPYEEQNLARSLIARDQLAFYSRGNTLSLQDCPKLLERACFLNDNPITMPDLCDPLLDYESRKTCYFIAKVLKECSPEALGKILSEIVSAKVPGEKPLNWNLQGYPVVISSDGKYQIDLAKGHLDIASLTGSTIPTLVGEHSLFKCVFPNLSDLKKIESHGPTSCDFIDEKNRKNRAFLGPDNKTLIFQKQIEFNEKARWCDFWPMEKISDHFHSSSLILQDTTCWKTREEPTKLYFLDKKTQEIIYQYDFNDHHLKCIDGKVRNNLYLADMKQDKESYKSFQNFDSHAQIWTDDAGKAKLVEFPLYGLFLPVDYENEKVMIKAPENLPGFHLAESQLLPALRRISGYLVFENAKGQKYVMLPNKEVKGGADSYTDPIQLEELDRNKKHPEVYFYEVNERGELSGTSLPSHLHLAFLHLVKRDYGRALKIIQSKATKLKPYSEKEYNLLVTIATFKELELTKDADPRATSLRLKTLALIKDNRKKFGEAPEIVATKDREWYQEQQANIEFSLIKDMHLYLDQLYHMPPQYKLKQAEEILLLNAVRNKDPPDEICQNRLFALAKTPIRKSEKLTPSSSYGFLKNMSSRFNEHSIKYNANILEEMTGMVTHNFEFAANNFYSLYKIAREELDPSIRNRLLRLLPWMNKFNVKDLAEILEGVLRNPEAYPPSEEVRKTLTGNKKEIQEFLINLHEKAGPRKSWNKGEAKVITKPMQPEAYVFNKIPPRTIFREFSPILSKQRIFGLSPAEATLTRNKEGEQKVSAAEEVNTKPSLFVKVDSEDLKIKTELEADRKELIDKMSMLDDQTKTGKANRVEARGINELKQDVILFANTLAAENWNLRDEGVFKNFKLELEHQITGDSDQLSVMKNDLLALANKLPDGESEKLKRRLEVDGKKFKEITFNDLQLLYVRGNAHEFEKRNPTLKSEDIQQLNAKIEDYLVLATLQKQRERIKQVLVDLEAVIDDKGKLQQSSQPIPQELVDTLKELSQDLLREVSAARAYNPSLHPEFLVFEYNKNLLLRDEQVKNIDQLLKKDKEVILQIIMGGGKSDILLYLLALKIADGDALSIIMVPDELIDTVSENMLSGSEQIFKQVANRINWSDTSLENLQHILEHLKSIQENREFLLVSNKEMHEFSLQMRELNLAYANKIETNENKINAFREIQKILKEKGHVIMDEVDTLLRCDFEVHKAIGKEEKVNPLYVDITSKIYNTLMTDPQIKEKIYFEFSPSDRPKKAKPFTLENYASIKSVIAENLLKHLQTNEFFAKEINMHEKQIDAYLLAEPGFKASLPAKLSVELENALAFLRSQIQIYLPTTLNKLHKEKYGFFPPQEEETTPSILAGPFENTKPHLGSQFGHYTEQMNYTIQAYLMTGIPQELIKKEMERLLTELKQNPLLVETESGAYFEYLELMGLVESPKGKDKYELLNMTADKFDQLFQDISKDSHRFHQFLGRYILPTITTYNKRLTSTAQMLPDMFKHVVGVTGTVEKDKDTFHPRFETIAAKGIAGKTASLLWKNSRKMLHTLSAEKPENMLLEMLENGKNDLHAIMDAGGFFKDIPHEQLAKQILDKRPDLLAVIYFDGNQRMILRKGEFPKIYSHQNDISPAKRFTIYDQPHCTGENIRQTPLAHAWITMNKNQNFRDLSQGIWRMRGFDKGQKVGIVIQKDLKEVIKSSLGKTTEELDIMDPILFAIKNQGHQQAEDNLKAIHQKIDNVVFQAISKLINSIDVTDLSSRLYRELQEFTVTSVDDTPNTAVETLEDAETVLNKYCARALEPLKTWIEESQNHRLYIKYSPDLRFDLVKMNESMQKVIKQALDPSQPMVPPKLPSREELLKDAAIEISVRQQVKQKQEQLTHVKQATFDEAKNQEWPRGVDIKSKGYFDPTIKVPSEFKKDVVPIVSARDGIEPALGFLDENLLLSLNLIITEKGGTPFGPRQKPLGRCLIIQDLKNPKQFKLLLLTGEDAEVFKERLKTERPEEKREQRLCLYDPAIGIYQQGSDSVDESILQSEEFQRMMVQYKFLSGETTAYSPKELAILKEMMLKKGNISEIEAFFKKLSRVVAEKNYAHTPIANLFRTVPRG